MKKVYTFPKLETTLNELVGSGYRQEKDALDYKVFSDNKYKVYCKQYGIEFVVKAYAKLPKYYEFRNKL